MPSPVSLNLTLAPFRRPNALPASLFSPLCSQLTRPTAANFPGCLPTLGFFPRFPPASSLRPAPFHPLHQRLPRLLPRVATAQLHFHPPPALHHPRPDLDQAKSQPLYLRTPPLRPPRQPSQPLQQHVGHRSQHQPHLVAGIHFAAQPIRPHPRFHFLDPILAVSSPAI